MSQGNLCGIPKTDLAVIFSVVADAQQRFEFLPTLRLCPLFCVHCANVLVSCVELKGFRMVLFVFNQMSECVLLL